MSRSWKIAFLVVLAVAAILFAYLLRAIFMPLLVALLIAYVLNPLLNWLEKRNVPRMASITGVYVAVLGILAGVVLWGIPRGLAQARQFVEETFTGQEAKIKHLVPHLKRLGIEDEGHLLKIVQEKVRGHEGELAKAGATVISFAFQSLQGFVAVFSFVALVPVYMFFLMKNLNPWWEKLKHAIPRAYREPALATLWKIHRANAAFFRGQVTISLIEGFLVSLGLTLMDVKFSFLFGALYAALTLIPFLGVLVGFTVTGLFVLADTGGFTTTFFLVAGLFVAIQALEGMVLQPLILGKETGLHPIGIILALLVSGELFGLFGMLIAIPIASTVKILFEDYVWPMFEDVADLTRVRNRPEVSPSAPPPPPPTARPNP